MKNIKLFLLLTTTCPSIMSTTAIVYNHSKSPIFLWPIYANKPPIMIAKIPNQTPGVITPPAKFTWPDADALVIVDEEYASIFENNIVNNIMWYYNAKHKPSNFDWVGEIYKGFSLSPLPLKSFHIFFKIGSNHIPENIEKSKYRNNYVKMPAEDFKLVTYGSLDGVFAPLSSPEAKDLENKY